MIKKWDKDYNWDEAVIAAMIAATISFVLVAVTILGLYGAR